MSNEPTTPKAPKSKPPTETKATETATPAAEAVTLPKYRCHKIVRACKIAQVDTAPDGSGVITPQQPDLPAFTVSQAYLEKHQPAAGGYFVVYEDSYQSYSPARAFETGYDPIHH